MWKKNEEQQVKSGITLCTLAHDDRWYIDNGCSHHMLGDNSGFISLSKTKDGHVILRDNTSAKVLCKGNASLGDEEFNVADVLLVEGLNIIF